MPGKIKRTSLAQEGLRRLRNTRPSLVNIEKVKLMEDMAEMMLRSGYPEEYRREIIQSSLAGYQRQVEASERGDRPLYRSREWREADRRQEKVLKKVSWYRPADSVLFLPVTPNSELANMARKVVEDEGKRLGVKVRVAERAGTSLRQQLVRTD